MLWGIPSEVNRFFRPVVCHVSKPIQKGLAAMVLALLLAPHYRRMKTIAGMVLGHRVHGAETGTGTVCVVDQARGLSPRW